VESRSQGRNVTMMMLELFQAECRLASCGVDELSRDDGSVEGDKHKHSTQCQLE